MQEVIHWELCQKSTGTVLSPIMITEAKQTVNTGRTYEAYDVSVTYCEAKLFFFSPPGLHANVKTDFL